MAMTITLADNADVDPYEGELIDPTWTDTHRDEVGLQMEAYLCVLLKHDVVTNWASLNAIYKVILTEFVARQIAVAGIAFNMATIGATFSSLIEPEDMIQLHIYRIEQIHKLLEKSEFQNFLGVT